MVKVMINKE